MQTRILFAKLQALLQEAKRGQPAYDLSTSQDINWLEHDRVVYKISSLLDACGAEATIENLGPLREFLQKRWSYVSQYLQNNFYSTPICFELADALSKVIPVNRYQLLMPSITVTNNDITCTDLNTSDMQYYHFIVSDDLQSIIEILPCLKSAENDGILKYPRIFPGIAEENLPLNTKKLSENEKTRLIAHSAETANYYEQIQRRLKITKEGASLGAFLNRLIEKLKNGGIEKPNGGEEKLAGTDANEGLSEFFAFLDILEETLYVDFVAKIPELKDCKPNGYFISKENGVWRLTYLNLDKIFENLYLSDICVDEYYWDTKLAKSCIKENKLSWILSDLSNSDPENLPDENKLEITNFIKSWHYNTRPADGSEKGDFYSRFDTVPKLDIKHYCDLLANPYMEAKVDSYANPDEFELHSRFCVNEIGNSLKLILDADKNQDLYKIFPKKKEHSDQLAIEILPKALSEAMRDLKKSFENLPPEPLTNLDDHQKISLLQQIFIEIVCDANEGLVSQFQTLPKNFSYKFFSALVKDPKIYECIDNIDRLCFTLKVLTPPRRYSLLSLLEDKLRQLIPDDAAKNQVQAAYFSQRFDALIKPTPPGLFNQVDKISFQDAAEIPANPHPGALQP